MRKIYLALFLISGFVIGSCNKGYSDDVIEGGTILAQTSFEGSMLPFKHAHSGADIYTDPTAPDGSQVLRFTYPPGHPGGYSTDVVWVEFQQGYNEVKVEYYFKYSENFFFNRVDNKQIYVDTGDQTNFFLSAVDNNYIGGTGIQTEIQYVGQWGNIGEAERRWPNMSDVVIFPNIWYKVIFYFKLNTNGRSNGILKVWVNNTQIMDYSDVVFNTGSSANQPCYSLKFDPVWGGGGEPKPNATDYFYVDAVKIWAGPFKFRV